MAMDPNFPNQAYPPQKQGGSKLLWGLGIGCGLVLLLCCGGGVAIYWYGSKMVEVTKDPVKVAAVARELVQVDLPDGFEPAQSFALKLPFVNVTMVEYQAPNGAGSAMLGEISGGEQLTEAQMRLQLQQQIEQHRQTQPSLSDVQSREIEVQVRGQPEKFVIEKGKDSQSNADFIHASGTFKTEDGVGSMDLWARVDPYTEDQVEKAIRSIK